MRRARSSSGLLRPVITDAARLALVLLRRCAARGRRAGRCCSARCACRPSAARSVQDRLPRRHLHHRREFLCCWSGSRSPASTSTGCLAVAPRWSLGASCWSPPCPSSSSAPTSRSSRSPCSATARFTLSVVASLFVGHRDVRRHRLSRPVLPDQPRLQSPTQAGSEHHATDPRTAAVVGRVRPASSPAPELEARSWSPAACRSPSGSRLVPPPARAPRAVGGPGRQGWRRRRRRPCTGARAVLASRP